MQYDISLKTPAKNQNKNGFIFKYVQTNQNFNVTKIIKKDSTNFRHVFDIWQVLFTVHTF
jgi:hypothetical protein